MANALEFEAKYINLKNQVNQALSTIPDKESTQWSPSELANIRLQIWMLKELIEELNNE